MKVTYVDGEIKDRIQVFGAGEIGKKLIFLLKKEGVEVSKVIDNAADDISNDIWGNIGCVVPEKGERELDIVIAIADSSMVNEIYEQLFELGYRNIYRVDCNNLYKRIEELSDSDFLRVKYYCDRGKLLNLENPVTLNEKLQWLKIHERNPLYVTLGDKYKVREYLTKLFGEKYLIPLLYVTYDYNDICEEKIHLENCAIKSNCWSGDVELIRNGDTVDYKFLRKKFEKIFKSNWAITAREWWYSQMTPCIIVEELLTQKDGKLPNDYKLHFFNGELQFIYCSIDREGANYRKIYSKEWQEMPFSWNGTGTPPEFNKPNIAPPPTLSKMIEMGQTIAKEIPYVRVDYYDVDGELYFGEITISHGAGFDRFVPEKYDSIYGEKLVLPIKKGENIDNNLEKFIPYRAASHEIWNLTTDMNFLKLDWNESTLAPSEYVRNHVNNILQRQYTFNLYPNTNNRELLKKIADYAGVLDSNVQVFPSSDVAHEDIVKIWLRKGDKCGLIWPTYDNFRATVELSDAEVIYCELPNYMFNEEAVDEFIKNNCPKMMYMCNPNNPTGELVSYNSIRSLLDKHLNVLFVVDEAYIEFSGGAVDDLIHEYANLIITRTFSKAFGLANFRIGYVVSAVDNIRLLSEVRNSKNITTLAQEAAIAALNDTEYMRKYVSDIEKGRIILENELEKQYYVEKVFKSSANFVTISVLNNSVKKKIIDGLAECGVYIRDLGQNPYMREHCIRITIGTKEQMLYLIDRINHLKV